MPNTSHPFAHRTNLDGTIDSICKTCFMTVGTAEEAAHLEELERIHKCDEWNLKVIRAALSRESLFKRQPDKFSSGQTHVPKECTLLRMDETLVIAIEKVKIIEVSQVGTAVLVTFSDGRVTTMESDDIYEDSLEPPAEPDRS